MEWYENDALFRKECGEGHQWERFVAHFMALQGLDVSLSKQTIRAHVGVRHEHEGSVDFRVQGLQVECKSRKLVYTSPKDFPYPEAFVDTVHGWESKEQPSYLICISRDTGAMMAISAVTKSYWKVLDRHDGTRNFDQRFYSAPRHLWLPIHLVVELIRRGGGGDEYLAACRKYHGRVSLEDGPAEDPAVAAMVF